MKKLLVALATVHLAAAASAAVVTYNLTGTGAAGTVASGSFSFDTILIGPNYNSSEALVDLLSFSVTLTDIAGLGGSTSFSKADPSSDGFRLTTDGTGAVSSISPGFDVNSGGWSLSSLEEPVSTSSLDGPFSDSMEWSATAVPELGTTVPLAAAALAGFALIRARRQRG